MTIITAGLASGCATRGDPAARAADRAAVDARMTIDAQRLETMLARGPVVIDVPAEHALEFHDMRVTARTDSTAYLNVNAGGVALAVLHGQLRFTGHVMRAGETCYWSSTAAEVEVAEFDAASFLAARATTLEKQVAMSLETVAARQAGKLWWGTVERQTLRF